MSLVGKRIGFHGRGAAQPHLRTARPDESATGTRVRPPESLETNLLDYPACGYFRRPSQCPACRRKHHRGKLQIGRREGLPGSVGPGNGVPVANGAGAEAEAALGPGQRRRQKNQGQRLGSAPADPPPSPVEVRRACPVRATLCRQSGSGWFPTRPGPAAATASAPKAADSVWQTATETPDSAATFASLGVPAFLVAALADEGITTPFPIQAATLPDAIAGRDILGRAKTGSGKTLGFSLPMVARLASGVTRPGRPRGLVLVPTRELATQVQEVLVPLAQSMGLRVATIFGGVSYRPQIAAISRRTDIVVACPGRLADIIGQGHCHLGDVEITVLDEADHMADLGFLPTVRRLLDDTPQRRAATAVLRDPRWRGRRARQDLHDQPGAALSRRGRLPGAA